MRMTRDNVLVKEVKKEQIGAIVLPEGVVDDWMRGEVIEVGFGRFTLNGNRVEPEIHVGDVVVFAPPMHSIYPKVVVDGEECIILPESAIWAIE